MRPLEEAYNNGLNAAWEAARKIALSKDDGGLDNKTFYKIFHVTSYYDAIKDNSATKAIEKIKEYESHVPDKDVGEIKVGDEVIVRDKEKGVVTRMTPYEVTVLNTTGGWIICTKRKNVKKTGKHYPQIIEVLEQMKGAPE